MKAVYKVCALIFALALCVFSVMRCENARYSYSDNGGLIVDGRSYSVDQDCEVQAIKRGRFIGLTEDGIRVYTLKNDPEHDFLILKGSPFKLPLSMMCADDITRPSINSNDVERIEYEGKPLNGDVTERLISLYNSDKKEYTDPGKAWTESILLDVYFFDFKQIKSTICILNMSGDYYLTTKTFCNLRLEDEFVAMLFNG